MGIRGFLKNILSMYLGIRIVWGYLTGSFTIDTPVVTVSIILLLLSLWFLLEMFGILPKAG